MSKKKKLARFAENETFPNMFQVSFDQLAKAPFHLKGVWHTAFFGNDHPITLELGCGKGEYTTGLAKRYPNRNYIGMDIKGARMWHGCKLSQVENLGNVAFLRTKIQLIENFFAPGEIDEIWITFPDPQPRASREKKRLTSPEFLTRYRRVMKPTGTVHLKTDDEQLYRYTLAVIGEQNLRIFFHTDNLYESGHIGDASGIATFYEMMWRSQGTTVKYMHYTLNPHEGP